MTDINDLKPKTMSGIKSLARKIKKRNGLTHAAALDTAAKKAGFASWLAARHELRRSEEISHD